MSLNKKIGYLLDNGFKPDFVSTLNEGKINLIYERLKNKKETKEETKTQVTNITFDPANTTDQQMLAQHGVHVDPTSKKITMTTSPSGAITEEGTEDDSEMETDIDFAMKGITQEPEQEEGPDYPGSNRGKSGEQESLEEKFESKAQQGLFWARCNKCKSDDCKWCKMAKEFSKSTKKKDYKKMPEKIHPEKTVKYKKKKKTNEEFTMANYFDKVASVYANNAMEKTIDAQLHKEQIIKKYIGNLVERNLEPTMKKRDLLKLIESEIQKKKGLNEDFYASDELSEDDDFMMGGFDAPVITPTKPKIKPNPKPDEEEEEYDEPMNPDEGEEPEPQAKSDEEDEMFNRFKKRFKMDMDRLDEATHKPLRFKKF